MSFDDKLEKTIKEFIKFSSSPVVIYSALWPFFKIFNKPLSEIADILLKKIINLIPENRGLLMPSFATGYKNGICNLDSEPSINGFLSEQFRTTHNVKRTLSAFFSFSFLSDNTNITNTLLGLKPEFAWGDGSIYEWMENTNVHFIMLGTHPTSCSYLHRMEWLINSKINYRYNKSFNGMITKDGKDIAIKENLFVRSLNPEAINDFTIIQNELMQNGMSVSKIDGIPISHMRALDMKNVTMRILAKDAFVFLKNKNDFMEKII